MSKEIQIGRYGRTKLDIFNEYLQFETKQQYTYSLVKKARDHMKISELFETWEKLNILEYVNSPQFEIDMKEYLTVLPGLCYTCPVKDSEGN